MRTSEPMILQGRTTLQFSLERRASIDEVQVSPVALRRRAPAHSTGELRVAAAGTPAPTVRGLSSVGLTLADSFHPKWRTSGSGSLHFRTALGFNGFLVDDPQALTGLSYAPQRTRDLLLALSVIGWIAIVALLVFAPRENRARLRSRVAAWRSPELAAHVSERIRDRLESKKSQ
jgi:hypothetical protein